MDLSQLYTTGTKLADVKPDFHGMPLAEWLQKSTCRMIQTVAAERYQSGEAFPIAPHTKTVRCLSPDAVWTEEGVSIPKASARARRRIPADEQASLEAPT